MTSPLERLRTIARARRDSAEGPTADLFRSSYPILWENESKAADPELPQSRVSAGFPTPDRDAATKLTKEVGQKPAPEATKLTKEGGQGIGEGKSPVIGDEERNKAPSLTKTAVDDPEERAAIIEYDGDIPRTWAEGFAALCTVAVPPGFSPGRWQRIVDVTGTFLDLWAAKAARCGWSDLNVFGCDPDRPDARFDCMGLVLLLDRAEVVGIDEHGADLVTVTGTRQRYRLRPLPPSTVSLWQLA